MIDPKELRLGNFVCYRSDISGQEKEIEVEWTFFAEDFWTKNSRPIPLSPEWLEKFGAIFPHHDFRCQIGELCFYWNPNGALFLNESGWNESISNYPIDAVHKIQNLYHSVTGKELELNP